MYARARPSTALLASIVIITRHPQHRRLGVFDLVAGLANDEHIIRRGLTAIAAMIDPFRIRVGGDLSV